MTATEALSPKKERRHRKPKPRQRNIDLPEEEDDEEAVPLGVPDDEQQ